MPVHTHMAAVINESSQVSTFGGINDGVLIYPEQIAASDALLLIFLLSQVSDDLRRKDTERQSSYLSSSLFLKNSYSKQSLPASHNHRMSSGKKQLVSTPDICYQSFSSLVSALCLVYLSDDLSHILYHHLICCYRLHCKQTPLMDVTPAEMNPLLAELK